MRTSQIVRSGIAAVALLFTSVSLGGAHATSYAPNPPQSFGAVVKTGAARKITLSWNAPSNATEVTMSGYQVLYRCLTKATKSGPCTGKWRGVPLPGDNVAGFYEVDDATHLSNTPVSIDVVLPSGTANVPVTFAITPVSDDEDFLIGETRKDTVTPIDVPTFRFIAPSTSPLKLTSTAKKRLTVQIASNATTSFNGSNLLSYTVQYSTNRVSWITVVAPSAGWSQGGASKLLSVTRSGINYYFRLVISSTAGSVTSSNQSVISL